MYQYNGDINDVVYSQHNFRHLIAVTLIPHYSWRSLVSNETDQY